MIYLSPQAYHKIKTAIEFSSWEVGFYGVTEDDDITRVLDVYMPIQQCNDHRNEFDDTDVNRYVANQLKKGLTHRQLTSVWIHTHPGVGAPLPSADDKKMHEAMVECGVGVSVMIILTKSAIKAWVKAKVPGLKRVIESEEDVNVDWLMDAPEKFKVAKWRKRYDRVVTHLEPEPVVSVVASGGSSHKKCIKCQCWRPTIAGYTQCCEDMCYISLAGICQSCRVVMGFRCETCYESHVLIREANKALCGNKAQPRLPLIDTQGYELVSDGNDDPPVEPVDPDNPPANEDNPDCDNRCCACPCDLCEHRYDEYDPGAECNADCINCIEVFCLDRDQVPSDCRCLGNCENCSVQDRCEWRVDVKAQVEKGVNNNEDK